MLMIVVVRRLLLYGAIIRLDFQYLKEEKGKKTIYLCK